MTWKVTKYPSRVDTINSSAIYAVFFLCMSCILEAPAAATDLFPHSRANSIFSESANRQLFSATPVASDPTWAVTLLVGASAGDDKLVQLLSSPWNVNFRDDYFAGGAFSRRLVRFWNYFTVEAELGAGGRFGTTNGAEVWGALFFRFDGFPWNNFVYTTIGASTGLSYLSTLPPAETHPGDPTSHLLHYFSPELTFAHPQYKQHELVVRYHHRSGVFGTFNGVWGGSNAIALGYRWRFDQRRMD